MDEPDISTSAEQHAVELAQQQSQVDQVPM